MGARFLMKKLFKILSKIIINLVKAVVICGLVLAALWFFYFSIDFIFKNVLPYISRAVLANFILFAGVITFVIVKLNVFEKMENAKTSIAEKIENSETAKSTSEENLHTIEDSIKHLDENINSILTESEERAKLVGTKILEDAQKSVLTIKDNAEKAIENSRVILKNDLIRRASLASIEVAKARIIEELSKNSELHAKIIEESLNAIEGVEL